MSGEANASPSDGTHNINVAFMPPVFSAVIGDSQPRKGSFVAAQLSELSGIPVERLLVVDVYNGKVFRVLFDARSNIDQHFSMRDDVVTFEIPENFTTQTHIMLELRLGLRHTPLLIPIERNAATTLAQVYAIAAQFCNRRMFSSVEEFDNCSELADPQPQIGDVVGGWLGVFGLVDWLARCRRRGHASMHAYSCELDGWWVGE